VRGTILLRGNFGASRLVVPPGATFPLLDGGSITTTTVNGRIVNNGTGVKSGPGKTTVNPELINSGLSYAGRTYARRAKNQGPNPDDKSSSGERLGAMAYRPDLRGMTEVVRR
jgi:hypothetical protein